MSQQEAKTEKKRLLMHASGHCFPVCMEDRKRDTDPLMAHLCLFKQRVYTYISIFPPLFLLSVRSLEVFFCLFVVLVVCLFWLHSYPPDVTAMDVTTVDGWSTSF